MRILLADDHPMFLESVRTLIERAFPDADIYTAETLPDALAKKDEKFDVIIVDYSMPGMTGAQSIREIEETFADTPIALMSGVATPENVTACLKEGAKGFLPKTLDSNVFSKAISLLAEGGTYIPAEYIMDVTQALEASMKTAGEKDAYGLTPREKDVLTCLTQGKSNKVIAYELNIQEVTVKLHLTRIYKKLGVTNRSQAALTAIDKGIVEKAESTDG